MLRIENTYSRTFEERMADNISAIPLLSKEWTNHNVSDPGITILENLTAFEALQGSRIDNLSDRAKLMLLRLAGFKRRRGKCARLLLSRTDFEGRIVIRNNQRFMLGDLPFETRRDVDLKDVRLTGIFSYFNDEFHDYSYLSDSEFKVQTRIFGKEPKSGDSIYFISNGLPSPGEDTWFYVTLDSRFNRNKVEDRADNLFAGIRWECYTKEGFKEMRIRDYTGAFLLSGEIKLRMPDEEAAVYEEAPLKGYCIRAVLTRANYDIRPVVTLINAFMFEVWQKDTRAVSLTFNRQRTIRVNGPYADEGYILVFGKEKKGSSYKRYELSMTGDTKGRFCLYEREKDAFSVTFDEEMFGYEPGKFKDGIKIVIYSEEIMRRYRVGTVIGYDDQEIDLPVKHIVPDSFSLIARRVDDDGEYIYDFVRPDKTGDCTLNYSLLENEGKIIIEDAGDFIGAELFMAGAAVTEGPKGNVRGGNYFVSPELNMTCGKNIRFYNPGPGTGGAFSETTRDVQKRFRDDIYTPYTCVTAGDYERAVSRTPGLCIRKVRAKMDELENLVHISVMPGTDEEKPRLSETYKKAIAHELSERRLITTRFQIMSPVYVAVSARSTVYVKRHFSNCQEKIEQRFREKLDYLSSDRNFGDVLKFEEVFRAVEELDCVEFIYELALIPENMKRARIIDTDIHPQENCLLYPGEIDLEIVTYEK